MSKANEIVHDIWKNDGWTLVDATCPSVKAVDAAQLALDRLKNSNQIDGTVYSDRCAIIALRRATIASTQEIFGCPRQTLADEGQVLDGSAQFNCLLPYGLTENLAYSLVDKIQIQSNNSKGIGF